jgi:hypothetical protein
MISKVLKTEMHRERGRLALVAAVFALITAIDAAALWGTRDRHLGIHEDHFDKGVSLYETGAMSSGSQPMVFRPPGYPVFVAVTLAVRDAAASVVRPVWRGVSPGGGRRVAVLAAHAVLLGVLGASLCWFALGRAGPWTGIGCAVAVACNPLLLLLAGHVSYELLHLVLVTIATLFLLSRAETADRSGRAMFGCGAAWGVATLVKSVTLIAPAFVLFWALLHHRANTALRVAGYFAGGMLLVVTPYTLRNYAYTGRLIPVNEQAALALWATSLERIPPGAKYQDWVSIWFRSGMKTYTDVTGASQHSLATLEENVLELSDRFGVMALDNLRRDPSVYAYNAAHNGVMFVVDPPSSYYFRVYAWPRDAPTSRFVAGLSLGLLTLVGAVAMLLGCIRREPRWTLLAALFAMMWAAHALTFLDARYLYVKVPTIAVAFVLACVAPPAPSIWRRGAVSVATLAAMLSVAGLLAL